MYRTADRPHPGSRQRPVGWFGSVEEPQLLLRRAQRVLLSAAIAVARPETAAVGIA